MFRSLYQKNRVDPEWIENLVLISQGTTPWKDFNTKEVLGTKVLVVIAKDNNHYDADKNGNIANNAYEKFSVKVSEKNLKVPANVQIKFVNPRVTLWGDYNNQISVKASGFKIIEKSAERHE
ncbi:hypothetical protein OGM84_05790 [Pediococcus acidilactici]